MVFELDTTALAPMAVAKLRSTLLTLAEAPMMVLLAPIVFEIPAFVPKKAFEEPLVLLCPRWRQRRRYCCPGC
jgi:hypothetical protein